MRTIASFASLLGCLAGSVFLLAACGREEGSSRAVDAEGPGEVVVSLLPVVEGSVDAGEVAEVAASIRARLEKLGFEEVSVATLPGDELLVRFASAPSLGASPRGIMDEAFSRGGVLALRRLHFDSESLVRDLKQLAQVGSEWWVAEGMDGRRHVVGEELLLGGEHVLGVETQGSSTGSGFDVIVRLDASGFRILEAMREKTSRQALALLLDRKVMVAPLSALAISGDRILVARGVSATEAKELAFIIEAPLVVPLQTKGQRGM